MTKGSTFVEKWIAKFENPNTNYIELVESEFAEDCRDLGFEMDCGHGFEGLYGAAVYNADALSKVIEQVEDITLLGSAIFSRWRYFNHWAYSGAEIVEPENRQWFLIGLHRLYNLASCSSSICMGQPKKLRLVSNNISYGPPPEPDDEVEQHITINAKGQIWFSAYNFGTEPNKHPKSRTHYFRISREEAAHVLATVTSYFKNNNEDLFATDVGCWTLELTNTEGKQFQFNGSLCVRISAGGDDLSDVLRSTTGLNDLLAFDGNNYSA